MTFEQWFYTLRLRLRSFFRRKQVDQELKDELRDHLEHQIKENLAAGMSPEDARYSALRQLCGSPGFSFLAILCLILGIGASAAVFSWIEGILFRPYPAIAHQERLLALAGTAPGESGSTGISWPDFLDLQRSCTLCEAFFVSKITGSTLSIGDRAEITTGSIVSANYFDAIGVHPILGRGFEPGEEVGSDA